MSITIFLCYHVWAILWNVSGEQLPPEIHKMLLWVADSIGELWVRNLPVEFFAQVVHLCQCLHHLQSFCVKICCANLEKMFWLGKKTFSEKRKCDIRQEFDDAGKFQHFYRICIKVLSNLIRFPVNIQWSLYSWCLKKEIFSMIHWAYWNNKLKGLKVAKCRMKDDWHFADRETDIVKLGSWSWSLS